MATRVASRGAIVLALAILAAGAASAPAAGLPSAPAPTPVAGAAACTPRLQVFFASTFKDQAYQQTAYQKVASSWKRPAASPKAGAKAVVIVTIGRDGKTTPPVLHLASGSDAWDAAALEALKKAAPFEPLPKSYSGPSVEVHFHFECAA
jgi:protein TonB